MQVVAERGDKIYNDKYRAAYEQQHRGKFVVIDVLTEKAYINDTPEGALDQAKADAPGGLFHLIQVGFPGAFRVSYSNHATMDRIFR